MSAVATPAPGAYNEDGAGLNGTSRTRLLVVGAGPYGLATAALAQAAGLDPLVIGEPMGFWRRNMPSGMLLRSSVDWHLDGHERHTLAAYLEERGISPSEVDPIPVELFIDYAEWFRAQKGIRVTPGRVRELRASGGRFQATLENGGGLVADAVVATPGVEPFTQVPAWVAQRLSPERYSHTCHLAELDRLAGARVLIIGGRQSAFEWAALLAERGAEQVYVVHRHDPPLFEPSDWSFAEPLIESTLNIPGWFRSLPQAERKAIERRFWAEGRLKLEPWLTPRLARPSIHQRPRATVTSCSELPSGAIRVELSTGEVVHIDHLILATGYKADLAKVPYLAQVLEQIEIVDGFPVLDEHFQTSLPGLFITGFAASRDFGPIFGFVRGGPAAATIITTELSTNTHAVKETRRRDWTTPAPRPAGAANAASPSVPRSRPSKQRGSRPNQPSASITG
jgi:FAD-dependent urate hydroxylase